MKSEERHELKENDLASWLQFGLWAFLKQNGSYVLLVLALGFLGFQLWRLYEQRQERIRQEAWMELRSSLSADNPPAELLNIIEKYNIKPIRAEAYLDLGGIYSQMILQPALMDAKKLRPEECLQKAQGYYKNALDVLGDDPLIAGKAHLGLAATYEDQGEWDKARAEYEILTANNGMFAGTPFADLATQKIATLEQRKNAPRLASMIPPPAPAKPAPAGLNPLQGTGLPGMFDQGIGPIGPSLPVTTAPGTPTTPTTPLSPFGNLLLTPVGPTSAPAVSMPAIEPAPTTAPK